MRPEDWGDWDTRPLDPSRVLPGTYGRGYDFTGEDDLDSPVPMLAKALISAIGADIKRIAEASGQDPDQEIPGVCIYITVIDEEKPDEEDFTFEIKIRRVDTEMVRDMVDNLRRAN